jgi:hypothetical protein
MSTTEPTYETWKKSLANAEQFFNGEPVYVRNLQSLKALYNFRKPMEPRRLSRHEGNSSVSIC